MGHTEALPHPNVLLLTAKRMSQVCTLHSGDGCHTIMFYIIVHCLLLKGIVPVLISALCLNKSHMPGFWEK